MREMKAKTNRKIIEQTVRNISEQIITDLGLELWNVEFYLDKETNEYLLEVTIDKPDGSEISSISFEDCEKVTHALNPLLDESDPIEQSYSFVVSSPGIDRELKTEAHITKYIGKPVTVALFAKRPDIGIGEKTFRAVLKSHENGTLSFEIETAGLITLDKKEVAALYAYNEI